MNDVIRDLWIGLRMLRKRPGMSVLAITALALGIGLTTTMFSIVNGAILRGLPFEESERILHLARMRPAESSDDVGVPIHDYLDWRDAQTTFQGLAAFSTDVSVLSGSGEAAERLQSARISANTFGLLGAVPVAGRDFLPADNRDGAAPVVVIGDRVWESQFARSHDAVGQTLRIDGVPTTVIGIMAPGFRFPISQDVWLPLDLTRPEVRGDGQWLEVIGRLGPGIDETAAQVELAGIAARLAEAYPENAGMTAITQPYLKEFLGTEVISTLFAMLGAVFGVLLVACANVTNLQVARMAERTREIAVRTAMGAGRWRIVRQLLVEGVVLTTGGAVFGVGLAAVGVWLFNGAIVDTDPPFWIDIRIDTAVLAFVVGITAAAAMISSLWPALRVTQAPTSQVLNDQGRGTTSLKVGVMTRTLVIMAVTLSCGLLLVSGLMIKTVAGLAGIEYPFAHEDVLMARLSGDARRYATDDEVRRLNRDLDERLAGVPAANAVGFSTNMPGRGGLSVLSSSGR